MKVGVPTEVKADEYRVALTPIGVRELIEHELGLAPDLLRARDDRRALRDVVGVAHRAADPGALLDDHLVTVLAQLPDAGRGERYPVLVGLDLGGTADLH